MLHLWKTQSTKDRWIWQVGQVALASAYPATGEPGLFYFSISGVHQQGAELFSTHARAEALLTKHLRGEVTVGLHAIVQSIEVMRADRWYKLERTESPAQESDVYTYTIGNVLLASLTNIKSIRQNGYHLYIPAAGGSSITTVLSIREGEQLLAQTLNCGVSIQPGGVSYFVGANHQPCEADWFQCQPTLYDGRPA